MLPRLRVWSPGVRREIATCLLFGASALPSGAQEASAFHPFAGSSLSTQPTEGSAPAREPKHFLRAAGELSLLELLPWAFDRYIDNEDFARISLHTVNQNLKTGFKFDRDHFNVNQSAHPYHGSLFFEAGRSNGYDFWESGLFALAGSLVWECCMENDAPSINDLVNTTLGGMTRGEISHRISAVILDNTATGSERFWRELGAAVVNPVGALTRLMNGDMTREFPNPEERYPGSFSLSGDLGYRRIAGGAHPNQGTLSVSALYGDPFAGDLQKPFDSFWVGFDVNSPGGAFVSRIEERGILKGWELTEPTDPVRHVFGFSQEYEYLNNASQVFGAQAFSAGFLSEYALGAQLKAVTDVTIIGVPLAGIKTTDFENPQTGRNYDYASGGGFRGAARLLQRAREVAAVGYGVLWARTDNGASRNNTLQFFRATVRVPVTGALGVGAGYWWYSRMTSYPGFFERRKTQSEWRAFLNFAFGGTDLRPASEAPSSERILHDSVIGGKP